MIKFARGAELVTEFNRFDRAIIVRQRLECWIARFFYPRVNYPICFMGEPEIPFPSITISYMHVTTTILVLEQTRNMVVAIILVKSTISSLSVRDLTKLIQR